MLRRTYTRPPGLAMARDHLRASLALRARRDHITAGHEEETMAGDTDRDFGKMSAEERDAILGRFRKLSWLLDRQFRIPGIPFRFGLDGLIGVIPGIGDGVTSIMGLYALTVAHREKLPFLARLTMVWNILVDFLVGAIPFIGDLFDFAFHAHSRNLAIIERHLDKRTRRDA